MLKYFIAVAGPDPLRLRNYIITASIGVAQLFPLMPLLIMLLRSDVVLRMDYYRQ